MSKGVENHASLTEVDFALMCSRNEFSLGGNPLSRNQVSR